ncbi:MAG: hypothetical protein A3G32_00035 [Deltaproteobacteria bacterium RIFCSPLOWO2_12_FULL_40_28]|nr:MAG: hypothetical protein A3C45_02830 [Deltaproteobacteria bacterium RIFCSPHIGHO2_02_FULL_40_28]OGQ20304.1 MAG: hypothetical protein A3E27_09415 [Deltaproteobacteria bacterium RIFCSPHIGHO2_12_FULL_40_32]OGQ40757.1 MAG: hypothetical protein A3I69_09430 [Deltaproteobacteria bacterium RIFCSPLOWO2_02_FULL_40_36]OGQ54904.1 MAG: hypothetical protein A3G32_00035 [Deltaproteobacteria bacterium RIFCSPLOWO2_12_FULL_40_28]
MSQNRIPLKNYQLPDKYGQWLGYKVEKVDRKKGRAVVGITLRDDHLSPAGRIHGGVISGFLDFACGAAVFSTMDPHDFCSTVEIKVNYMKPLFSGDKLTSKSEVIHRGNHLCIVCAFLYRKNEKKPVAMATATFNIVSKKS